MMSAFRSELREMLWLASVIGGLSVLGVMLGVAVAVAGQV